MPASSSCTGSRPSRSSGSMSRTRVDGACGSCSSTAPGTVSTGSPVDAASSQRAPALRRRRRRQRDDQVRGRAANASCRHLLERRPAPARRRCAHRCLAGSSSSRPSTIQPWLVDAGQQPAAPPRRRRAPARAGSRASPPVMRDARVFVDHAVGDAHHAHAHQRDHRVQRQHRARHLAQAERDDHRRTDARRPARRPASAA